MSYLKNKPVCRQKDIVVQEFDNDILIYDLKDNKVFCLNETSALIWQMCGTGNKSITDISQELSLKLKTPISDDLVWLAIEQLKKADLIENDFESPDNLNGLNRRQAIRQIGLTSVVALPIISIMVAPNSVEASSKCTQAGQLPGYVFTGACSNNSISCNTLYGSQCCTNMAITQSNPCPSSPGTPFRCVCA